nr:EAL domain-containing protein [Alteromonas antoniana]
MCIFFSTLDSAVHAVEITDFQFTEVGQLVGREGLPDDALSDTTIFDIAEDSKGYIWIATMSGLNRYSGYDTKHYFESDTNPHSVPSGLIRALHVDESGTLWVATFNGLARYIPETDNFEVFNSENSAVRSNDIIEIAGTADGNIIFSDRKNFIYERDQKSGKIALINENIRIPQRERVRVLFDEVNRIWIGTSDGGAYIYSKEENRLYNASKVNPWGINISANSLFDIEVIKGEYWLATDEGIKVVSASGNVSEAVHQAHFSEHEPLKVVSLQKLNSTVWAGTDKGLFILELTQGNQASSVSGVIHVNSEYGEITGLTQEFIPSIFKDSTDGLWLGTYQGLFRYHPEKRNQKLISNLGDFQDTVSGATIWGLDTDHEGHTWVATQGHGLGKYDPATGKIDYYLTEFADKSISFWDLDIDKYGVYWVATSEGLLAFEYQNEQMQLLTRLFEGVFVDRQYFDGNRLWIWLDKKGLVSVQTNLLQQYLSNNSDQFIEYYSEFSSSAIRDTEDSDVSLPLPIFKDDANRLWLSNDDGISLFNIQRNEVVKTLGAQDGLKSRAISVYQTSDNFWVTTRSDGIYKVSKRNLKVIKKQSRNEGGFIFSSVGYGNFIWYADNQGVNVVDLSTLQVVERLNKAHLSYNSLNEGAVTVTPGNTILFGGNRGFNSVLIETQDSSEITNEQKTRSPQLFEFTIFGQKQSNAEVSEQQPQEGETKVSNITYKQEEHVKYDETRFSISFGLLNPLNKDTVKHQYRLVGYDDAWLPADKARTAQFNNLSFGHYVFEVQAKESGKQWSESRTLDIYVARPPWLHTVALGFYALVLTVALIYIIRQYQIRKTNQQAIYESEERLKLTLWSSGDELWDWDVYRGQVYRANTWGTLDFPQDNIRTNSSYDANIHPNDIVRVQEALKAHLAGKTEFFELAYRARTFKNKWIWILDRGKVVQRDHNNQPVRMTGTLKNIHHLKEAEEQLNLFKRSIENISEGVFITNTQFKFISVNNAYCNYTGETRDQALASYMYFHQYPEAFTEEIKKTLRTKSNWSGEVESTRVNGERYEMELNIDAVHDEDGKISHFVGVFSDITSRKSTEKELLKLANTDPLTDLPNRSFFQASHNNLVRKAVPHTLLCLDMDNFKKINDSLGHQTGDILIKQIAKRIQRITGKDATCYRLGGDEFSVLMEDYSDIHTITHYAQSVLDTLSRPFIINKQEFVLGASIGIAFYPDDGNTPQEMLKNADTAMYFAKNNGGNSYQFFSGEMNQNAVRQLQIENLIRQGIKDDLFTVYYQPKVDIASGKLVSMEALVRFEHPHKGIVSPGQFIPLAEQTGQIIEIGEQVLRKACADTKRWVNQGLFSGRVAVNISVKQFELPDLDDRIDKILAEVGLSPLHLECEITEGTLMENPEAGLKMMERLRERGIHLALDDFGTGYSSLAYLKRFPLNTLKIDKAFIDDIAESSVDRHMAAAIINIAHNLGLKVVAEGVEEEKQLTILRRYDCEMLQGYLYSKPLNAERFEKLLKENQKLHHLIGQSSL